MMRFRVTFIVVLLGLGAFVFIKDKYEPLHDQAQAWVPLAPIAEQESTASQKGPQPLELAPIAQPGSDAAQGEADRSAPVGFGAKKLVEFHGAVLLQPKGQRPYAAVRGSIELSVLYRGQYVPVSAAVNLGTFSAELPDRSRIRIVGGQLEDQAVRFLGSEAPFDLNTGLNYALVGEPVPVKRLLVFEGTQHVPLSGVTVRTSVDGVTALMQGADPVGEVLALDAASPIDLPYLAAKHRVWLHVSAEGYATTALLVDPQKTSEKEVVLWPSATLTVRVTGPARGRLKALLIHRHEPPAPGQPATKQHFATFGINSPGITTDPDATIFSLENLPALLLTIEARGFDKRGREALLGKTTVELGSDQAGLVNLRVENK